MKRLFMPFCILSMVLFSQAWGAVPEYPDAIYIAGRVYTLDPQVPIAEAVAVKNGLIMAVGSESEITALADGATVVRRLDGAVIVPGLVDAHCHLLGLGLSLDRLDLVGTPSFEEIVKLVRDKAATTPKGEWILGRGWDQNDWRDEHWPTRYKLDGASRDNPVYLKRIDGHAALANSVALSLAGVNETTPDPEGGVIIRENGRPTGVLIDNAMHLLNGVIPSPTKEQKRRAILMAADLCMSAGLVGIHEAGVTKETLELYREMADAGELPFFVYAMIDGAAPSLEDLLAAGPEVRRGGRLTVRSVKLFADGALGSRGAALIEPYADDPGNTGLLMVEEDSLAALTEAALDHGFQVCVHAIGDRANRVVLNAYEKALSAAGMEGAAARLRVEHAQILSPSDIPRFASLGVVASMQPTHCTSDMPWAPDRLGPERLAGAYAWRSILESGAVIAGGSDFPVESHDPLLGFYAAVTRRDKEGRPAGGWHPKQKMTRTEALSCFTRGAAYAAFEEGKTGSLKPGMRADMTVFSTDIMRVPEDEILSSEVVMTIIGGKVVYQQEEVE